MSLLSLDLFYLKNNKSMQYNIAIILGLLGLFLLLLLLYPTRVGDGSEYYAMYFAWKDTFRPFMTEPSWSEVGRLADSESIRYFVPLEFLKNAFPALKLGSTADFNHFWFYSFLAALISNFFSLLGIKLSPHISFLILHLIMFLFPCILARRYFGCPGLLAVLLLTFFSPILWFIDKVHTEFFTYCLSLSAVIFSLRQKYITAAFFLSIASTQNISF